MAALRRTRRRRLHSDVDIRCAIAALTNTPVGGRPATYCAGKLNKQAPSPFTEHCWLAPLVRLTEHHPCRPPESTCDPSTGTWCEPRHHCALLVKRPILRDNVTSRDRLGDGSSARTSSPAAAVFSPQAGRRVPGRWRRGRTGRLRCGATPRSPFSLRGEPPVWASHINLEVTGSQITKPRTLFRQVSAPAHGLAGPKFGA